MIPMVLLPVALAELSTSRLSKKVFASFPLSEPKEES